MAERWTASGASIITVVAMGVVGCAHGPAGEDGTPPTPRPTGVKPAVANVAKPPLMPLPTSYSTEPVVMTDAKGRAWSVRRITEFGEFGPEVQQPMPLKRASSKARTDEEEAERQRAIKFLVRPDGVWRYDELVADVARVRAARAKNARGVQGYNTIGPDGNPVYVEVDPLAPALAPAPPPLPMGRMDSFDPAKSWQLAFASNSDLLASAPATSGPGVDFLLGRNHDHARWSSRALDSAASPRYVDNPDGRHWTARTELQNDFSAPNYRGFGGVAMSMSAQPWPSGCTCSADMIGRGTALTAAHCFYYPPCGGTLSQRAMAVGAVRTRNDGYMPPLYDSFFRVSPWNGCYWYTINYGWVSEGGTSNDFAVIDYFNTACDPDVLPGDLYSWSSFYVNPTEYQHLYAYSWLFGYDAGSTPPNPVGPTTYLGPSLIDRNIQDIGSTFVWPYEDYPLLLASYLDVDSGASGSALQQNNHPYTTAPVVVGTLAASGIAGEPNAFSRRLENTYWSFVQAHAWEY